MGDLFGGGGGVDAETKRIQRESAARARRQEQAANQAAQREQAESDGGARSRRAGARAGRALLRFTGGGEETLG